MIDAIHQSMVGMWLRCGLQFQYRYLDGNVMPPSIKARTGSAVHKAAEINNQHKITAHEDLPLDVLQDAARDEYVRLLKDEGVFIPRDQLPEKARIINDNLNDAIGATGAYRSEVAPKVQPIFAEKSATVDIGLDLPIAGKLDTGTIEGVRDIKVQGITRNQAWADAEIQPDFYWHLYKEITGAYPQSFTYDALVTLKSGVKYNPLVTRRSTSLTRIRQYCAILLRDIQTGHFRPADPESWACSPTWCGWWQTCPHGARSRIIL